MPGEHNEGRRMRAVFLDTAMIRKLSILTVFLCFLLSFVNQNPNNATPSNPTRAQITSSMNLCIDPSSCSTVSPPILPVSLLSRFSRGIRKVQDDDCAEPRSLEYDYYRDSCPEAEQVIRAVVRELNTTQPETVPALLLLVFHDCFIEVCLDFFDFLFYYWVFLDEATYFCC